MATIEIDVPSPELETFRQQWNAVIADLESAGHRVVVVEEREVPSGGVWLPLPASVFSEKTRVIVDAGDEDHGDSVDAALLLVVEAVRRRLRGRMDDDRLRTVEIVNRSGDMPLALAYVREER